MSRLRSLPAGLALVASMVPAATPAQSDSTRDVRTYASGSTLTLDASVREALRRHPRIALAQAGRTAAASDLALSRAAQRPTVDAQWQTLRATGNAVAGAHFSMAGVPPVGGPPGNASPGEGVWGTTAALVASMPIAGLLRTRRVVQARLLRDEAAGARLEQVQLEIAAGAAAAFLEVRAGQAQRRVALAARQRALTIDSMTRALAAQGVRPGADSMRTLAEIASAEIELARAERTVAVADARLGEAIGTDRVVTADTGEVRLAIRSDVREDEHPAEHEAAAMARAAEADRRVAATAWLPRLELLGAAFARGSGEPVPGIASVQPMRGIAPNVGNWALGLVASWPLTGVPAIRAQQRRAEADVQDAQARARAVHNQVEAARAEADASFDGAQRVAQGTGILVRAATATLEQMVARYRAGLTTLVDVADAQRQLARAEVDDAVARLEVIAARLQRAQARGDLAHFLALVDAERAP